MITIIGLGCTPEALSLAAHNELQRTKRILVKTAKVPAFAYFETYGLEVRTFDERFERAENFDDLYREIGEEVLACGREEDLCYCVEGSGLDDRTVAYILGKDPAARLLPAGEKGSELLAACPSASAAIFSATDFCMGGYSEINHAFPLVLREIDTQFLASEVKLRLFADFPEQTPVLVSERGRVREIPLYELDRLKDYDSTVGVLLRPEPLETRSRFGFSDLVNIVRRLRAPGGCPWDREQTHNSLRINLLEEAYEALEAVELADADKMCEEMGDVLLQSVFHAVIGEEDAEFSVSDMLSGLCKKLVFRHSHIFGEDKAQGGAEALLVWDRNKSIEKNQKTLSDKLRAVPKTFPALLYANKIQQKASKVISLDDPEAFNARFAALRQALSDADSRAEPDALFGDALFEFVNTMRLCGVEPELALLQATDRFVARLIREEEEKAREENP